MATAMLDASEIPWTLPSMARLEDAPIGVLLGLAPDEVLSYAADCREDLRAVRSTLSEALAMIARQHDQLVRAARVIEHQRQQLRSGRSVAA
jgi:hypothetical protein